MLAERRHYEQPSEEACGSRSNLRRVQKHDETTQEEDRNGTTNSGLPPLKNAMARDPRAGQRLLLPPHRRCSQCLSKRLKMGYAAQPTEKSPTKSAEPFSQKPSFPDRDFLGETSGCLDGCHPQHQWSSQMFLRRASPSRIEKRRKEAREHEWALHMLAEQDASLRWKSFNGDCGNDVGTGTIKIIRRILVAFEFYWAWLTTSLCN